MKSTPFQTGRNEGKFSGTLGQKPGPDFLISHFLEKSATGTLWKEPIPVYMPAIFGWTTGGRGLVSVGAAVRQSTETWGRWCCSPLEHF